MYYLSDNRSLLYRSECELTIDRYRAQCEQTRQTTMELEKERGRLTGEHKSYPFGQQLNPRVLTASCYPSLVWATREAETARQRPWDSSVAARGHARSAAGDQSLRI